MRSKKKATCALAMLAWITSASEGNAETAMEIAWRTIGASVHTSVNLDGESSPASFIVADGDGTFGPASVQGMSEPKRVPIERCPPDTAMEFHMVAGTMVRTLRDTLEQIFVETDSGLACISRTGVVTSQNVARIAGGTGRFEGATGALTTRTLPQTVSFATWKGEFNNIMNVSEGTIILKD